MAERLHVIYDGQCGFCIRAMRLCRRLDVRGRLRFHDGTRQQIASEFPELAHADLENAMFAVAPDGTVHRGFFAFRRLAWNGPLMWLALPLVYLPGARWIGPRAYAWVARNRQRFGCESDRCERPPSGGSR